MESQHLQHHTPCSAYHLDSPLDLSSPNSSNSPIISTHMDGFPLCSASLPPHLYDPLDDATASHRDPVLQYIHDMLLEEDLEDHKCMQFECTAYQATAKGFYDILRVRDEPSLGEADLGLQQQQPEQAGSYDYQWMDNLLNSDSVSQILAAKASSSQTGSPPWSSASPDSAVFSSAQSSESTSESSNEISPLPPNAVARLVPTVETPRPSYTIQNNKSLPGSSLLDLRSYVNNVNRSQKGGVFQHGLVFGDKVPKVRPSHGFAQKNAYRRTVSASMDSVADTVVAAPNNVSRLKRASSETDSGGNAATRDTEGGELSFVQNKDLNAEVSGEMLHGLSITSAKPCRIPSAKDIIGKGARKPEQTVDWTGLLLSCAQAVASGDLPQANHILQQIRRDASPFGDGAQRVAYYFVEGLVARLSGTGARLHSVFINNHPSAAKVLRAHRLLVEVDPSPTVSHFFANKALLKAAEGAARLHIVDYGISYGLQWPSLITALAVRKGGPPTLRITAIEFPQIASSPEENVEITGRRLAEYAKTYGVPFEFRAIVGKWENVQPSSLHLQQDEVLVVNSMFRMRHLLDETVLASNPRSTVLRKIRSMNPSVFAVGIKNASYNSPFFKSRFKQALSCFSNIFDMVDTTIPRDNQERLMIERGVLGKQILSVVSCEGPERLERPETYRSWQKRIQGAGFEQIPLDAKVINKVRDIVKRSYQKDFGVDEEGNWLLLSWKGHITHGQALWKPPSTENI